VSANVWQQFGLISTVATFKDGMVYQQTQNAQDGLYVGGRASYYYDGLSWMEVTLAGSYGYTRYWGTIPNLPRVVEGRQWGVSASFDFTFNSSRTLSGYLYTEYVGRRYKATGSIEPTYSIQPGIYWSLFKRRLFISLAGMNLIEPRYNGESKREGYTIVYNNRYDFPTVYEDYFAGGMGAEAIQTLIRNFDLDAEAEELRTIIAEGKGQKKMRALKRLKVVAAFQRSRRSSGTLPR